MPPALMMPLFVRPKDVILRMQLDEGLNGVNDVITSGIIGAQLYVQRIIRGKLQRQHQDAIYYLDADAFSGIQRDGVFRLEVASAFIRQDTPVVITVAETRFGDYTEADAAFFTVNYEAGYILLDKTTFANQYVRVQCDTGFEDGSSPVPGVSVAAYDSGQAYVIGDLVVFNGLVHRCIKPTTGNAPTQKIFWELAFIPLEQIPEDVYEAIMAMVPVIFDGSQTTNRNAEAKSQYEKATDHAMAMLQPFIRLQGFTFRAL